MNTERILTVLHDMGAEYTFSTQAEAEAAAQELRDTDKTCWGFKTAMLHHTDNEPQVWIIEIYGPPPARQYIGSL